MLRRHQIRYKLLAVLLVPLVALTVLALLRVGGDLASGQRAGRVNRLAGLAGEATGLIHELQAERDLSLAFVAGGRADDEAVTAQRRRVDQAAAALRAQLARLDLGDYHGSLRERLTRAQERLRQLGAGRRAVDGARPDALGAVQRSYGDAIAALVDAGAWIVTEADDRTVIRNATSLALLSRLKELASRERGVALAVVAAGRPDQGRLDNLLSLAGAQDALAAQFQAAASAAQQRRYDAEVGDGIADLAALRRALRSSGGAGTSGAEGARARGTEEARGALGVLTDRVDRLREVEVALAADVNAASRASRSAALLAAVRDALLIVLALALALAVSLLLARSLVEPLLRLRDAANEVAERRLPQVVERVQRGELTDVEATAATIELCAGGEIGEVADAFNAVHRVALRVAAEQAALRMEVAETFRNLARRSQALLDRQLALIDDLERDADPEALAQLFKLDHLATRMRRHAENLMVLSGAPPPRNWSRPLPLADVVRAAIGEVEDYQRVELRPIEEVALAGHAAVDVVHLLAELIENATSFSPPGTTVQVAGQRAAGGCVLEVSDRGLGMSEAELAEANARLADPPALDSALSRMLGLYVVGRLAGRHQIRVQLRRSLDGGVTALVMLPHALVTSPEALPAELEPGSDWFDASAAGGPRPGATGGGGQGPVPRQAAPRRQPGSGPDGRAEGGRWPALGDLAALAPFGLEAAARKNGNGVVARGGDGSSAGGGAKAWGGSPARDRNGSGTEAGNGSPARNGNGKGSLNGNGHRPANGNDDGVNAMTDQPPEESPPGAEPPAPAPGAARTTESGLPRRVPRANLSPGIASGGGQDPEPADGQPSRSPEEIREMLSSYRNGLERGRRTAASPEAGPGAEGPDDRAAESGETTGSSDGSMAPRSTDDPAQ